MKTVLEQLEDFIVEAKERITHRLWLEDDKMKVYVRKGMHMLTDKKLGKTLDVAAVEVRPEYQQQGLFTEFLTKAHELNPWDATYVECVNNVSLATSLIKRGWFPVNNGESYFMLKDMSKLPEFLPNVI